MLSEIPSETLDAAVRTLPNAATVEHGKLRRIVQLPNGTRAEVTFVKICGIKGKTTGWFWKPNSAVIVP
jgi:hypothetical protein